jgi:hypothetical protein
VALEQELLQKESLRFDPQVLQVLSLDKCKNTLLSSAIRIHQPTHLR